ncbi:MAG: tRNA pseudouridine(38-40) synthase TruA [Puniceicoccales bacterium]|jgi:tRNA pseudouridine38-40 synthase|nr:tRNA pseudouridine(38-40) synthase TruA [Puniceicoccales bacterium]
MRWKCICSYDGTDFDGWQSQPSGNGIQDILEKRLAFICDHPVRIHSSGRTDAGVHAISQVFHFDGEWKHGADRLVRAFGSNIPRTIQVFSAEEVAQTFHARFSAIRKRYEYHMLEGEASPFNYRYVLSLGRKRLNVEHMNEVAEKFLGEHDFSAFGAAHDDNSSENTIKIMHGMRFVRHGNRVTFITEGSGYLYKMVRILAGCFLQVGLGKIDGDSLIAALDSKNIGQENFRRECLPAWGLFLARVYY